MSAKPMDFSTYISQIRNAIILNNENLKSETIRYFNDISVKLASALQEIDQLKSELAKNSASQDEKGKSKKQWILYKNYGRNINNEK